MSKKKIIIINGPNLNLLGKRKPEVYGRETFETWLEQFRSEFADRAELDYFQSNSEGALIDKIHEAGFSSDGIILNAGAYTHTSAALGDAIEAVPAPVLEVHISNVFAREPFRHHSFLSPFVKGVICGLGKNSYRTAIFHLISEA